MTDSFTPLSFFLSFLKQRALSTKLLVCTFFLTQLSLRSWNRAARHHTHLLWTSTNKLSSPLDVDRLRWDWWLWLERGISESACSPLTIFYKLLPVVNVVSPAPYVSVTEGWKHTYAPWSQFHNMNWGAGDFPGSAVVGLQAAIYRYQWRVNDKEAHRWLLQGPLCYFC